MKKTLLTIVLLCISVSAAAAVPDAAFEFYWNRGPIKVEKGGALSEEIQMSIPEGYFLYVDKTDLEFVTLEGIEVKAVDYPPKEYKPDPLGGEPVPVYTPGGTIRVKMAVPGDLQDGEHSVAAILHYQGCSEKLCLKPAEKYIEWTLQVGGVAASKEVKTEVQVVEKEPGLERYLDLIKVKTSGEVLNIKLKWLIIMAFIGGVLSGFTPCVLPLIPITLLIIGVNPKKGWLANLSLSVSLVLGMAITYSILGLVAASIGIGFGFLFQNKLFLLFVIVFLFAMGLSLLGVYTFQLPTWLQRFLTKLGGRGYRGAFLAGISMGLLATPCVGPVLGALLLYVGLSKSLPVSFLLLMLYSMGIGLVIIVIGTWYGTMVGRLKKARVKWIKKVIGFLILLPALYYLNTLIPFSTLVMNKAEYPIKWQTYNQAAVNDEKKDVPKMIFFTAKWCPPCEILKAFMLKDKDVVQMAERLNPVMVDMTASSPANEELVKKFDVRGWPTIVFTSPDNQIYNDLTLSGGFITKQEMITNMKHALERGGS